MIPIAPSLHYDSSRMSDIVRKKRTRAKRSCEMCRKKKTKCDVDTNQPCTKCMLVNVECHFVSEQKKRAPSTRGVDVELLENRLKRMENMIEKISKDKTAATDSDEETGSTGSPVNSSLDDEPNINIPRLMDNAINNKDEGHDDDEDYCHLQEQLKGLTIKDYQRTRYVGPSSGFHYLSSEIFSNDKKRRLSKESPWFIQKLNSDDEEFVLMKTRDLPVTRSSESAELTPKRCEVFADIPSMTNELADFLVHVYFTRVHTFFPLINKIQFLEQYYFHNPTPPDSYLLWAITSIGAKICAPDASHMEICNFSIEQLEKIHRALRSKAETLLATAYKRSMISTVQTLILLSMQSELYENDENVSQWFIAGSAIRMAQDLGLHCDCSSWKIPETEKELRKRIWYTVYLMDKWVAAELGRSVTILDHEFDVGLPHPYEISSGTPNHNSEYTPILILEAEAAQKQHTPVYSCFLHIVTLSQIMCQLLVGFYSPRTKNRRNVELLTVLEQSLSNWKRHLASELLIQLKNNGVINILYKGVLILLHRRFLTPDEGSTESIKQAARSLKISREAATSIIDIMQSMTNFTFSSLPWNIAM
ncbi:fungal-specific transcription factor domain-containing protein [Pilobolus umbonatus]|nr:fungal-specific transcription factor domain-containing protein [Pilobolus umbonatus]